MDGGRSGWCAAAHAYAPGSSWIGGSGVLVDRLATVFIPPGRQVADVVLFE